jgi:hypothetical protein
MQSSPLPCFLVPLRPKYPPQHHIRENHQPTFFPQCEQPSFTPIQYNNKNFKARLNGQKFPLNAYPDMGEFRVLSTTDNTRGAHARQHSFQLF